MFSFFHLFIDSTQTHAITHSHTHDRVIQSHTRPDGRTQNDDDDDDDDQSQVNKEFDKSFKRFVISSFFGIWSTQLKLSELKPNENVPTSSEQSHSLYTINEWTHKMCCDSVCNGFCEWIDSHNLIDWNRERANTSLTPKKAFSMVIQDILVNFPTLCLTLCAILIITSKNVLWWHCVPIAFHEIRAICLGTK